jgi:hypothetical protein
MPWKPDYVTVAQIDAYLRIDDTVDDTEISGWATAASRAVDKRCNRQFGQVAAPVARVYRRPPYLDRLTGLWALDIDDVQTATGFTVNGVAYATSGATLLPDNAPLEGKPWTALGFVSQPVWSSPGAPIVNTLVAQWGWTAVPVQVVQACKLQCARWNARRDSPFGIAGSPENGSEIRLLARLDPDVSTSLAGLARRRRAG